MKKIMVFLSFLCVFVLSGCNDEKQDEARKADTTIKQPFSLSNEPQTKSDSNN